MSKLIDLELLAGNSNEITSKKIGAFFNLSFLQNLSKIVEEPVPVIENKKSRSRKKTHTHVICADPEEVNRRMNQLGALIDRNMGPQCSPETRNLMFKIVLG